MWKDSDEFKVNKKQIATFHEEYASKASAADASSDSGLGYAASTATQLRIVTYRAFQNYWRSPTYLIAKIMLNIIAGLFVGFSFWNSPDNLPGLQNKSIYSFVVT